VLETNLEVSASPVNAIHQNLMKKIKLLIGPRPGLPRPRADPAGGAPGLIHLAQRSADLVAKLEK
jgi:hypothetical protein